MPTHNFYGYLNEKKKNLFDVVSLKGKINQVYKHI